MTTELRRRKYEKAFERFDMNHDGVLQEADITAMAKVWCDTFGAGPRSPEAVRINELASTMWHDILAATDTDSGGTVSKAEWHTAMARPDFVEKVALPFALAVFDVADRDNDGKLSADEMIAAQSKSGISESETRLMFEALDADKDGSVERDEYAAAIRQFYLSDDPNAVGNLMVGDLS